MKAITMLIHIGLKTQTQDEEITFKSLTVINTIASNPIKPIPLLELELELFFIY
jgi:hypothetical protein